ncbi:MAG: hypothetical protein EOP08_10625 [Proteobacteria bacterium]|nr:MAG: hypothetical protein EOP08_10625 [Pseudomonadota bacterium]
MKRHSLPILAALVLPVVAHAYDPVITDNRLIPDERRLALLEGKIASLAKQLELVEDHKAIERLQQAWGHYLSEGDAREAARLFAKDAGATWITPCITGVSRTSPSLSVTARVRNASMRWRPR